ncbi:MAG: T9SS type A sorting domain-containing protein, partial [Bacteroidales bacterium]|nr:T9SS type A sorting domain-containing protein [Bacteroidales bacterium]
NAWENYRNASYSASFTTLEKGRGYLYRNASDLTIAMTGDINVEDFTYDVTKTGTGEYAGFNLIGNPYTHDIYKGTAITNGTSELSIGFYYLEPSTGKWAKGKDNSTAIAPNQGILVQVDGTGNINMVNTNSNGGAKSNNDYIMLSVANSQYSDEAYAWFDKGIGLNKIEHRNSEIPMLYINQNDENFAIATMSDETQSFNLNFKAATMGKYTLSYKAKGEYNYLHVIDRLTGEDVDMLLEDEYSFIGAPTDNDNRFIVKLCYNANSNATVNDIFAYQSGSDIIVNGEGELQIFDVTGRKVATQHVNGVETINVQLQGVYIFKLNEKVQKIVVR